MSDRISLAFSVLHHYLKAFADKHSLSLPNFPHNLTRVDVSHYLTQAETLVLGKTPTKNHHDQLACIFEQISLTGKSNKTKDFHYNFKPLSADAIFPTKENHSENIKTLWQAFIAGVEEIPHSHRENLSLWLDHFDTALQCFTSNIASPYSDEISFYDFTKTVAAFVVALAEESADKNKPFLLIQGDFFGIQDFIFSGGSESNKGAAKILRGRSFQVSLFTELAALKLLNACNLPTTSQMMNAAGKFLIIAPNTKEINEAIKAVQQDLNNWFIKNTYGLIGLGIAVEAASENEFAEENYKEFIKKLFESLEEQKLKRLDLTNSTQSIQEEIYPNGVCEMNRYFPAEVGKTRSVISQDQIKIGELLAKKQRIIIADDSTSIHHQYETQILKLDIFNFKVIFTENEQETGKFGLHINQIHRFWDFSLAKNMHETLWNGYARRYINAYVPYFSEKDIFDPEKYKGVDKENQIWKADTIKPFDVIACEDRQLVGEKYQGQNALMTLKGDVDNLGSIFQKGIQPANIAKMAALSRQMNQFFSLWLPAYCAENRPNMYTVFAGGDDFFLIGPWYSTQEVAFAMQQAFAKYVAKNVQIHFSVGMVMSKSSIPVPRLGDLAEEALEKAKGIDAGKNAVTIFNHVVKWKNWEKTVVEVEKALEQLNQEEGYHLSTSYLYALIHLASQAQKAQDENSLEDSMWRSRLHYKTVRYVVDKLPKDKQKEAVEKIIKVIYAKMEEYKGHFQIPLFNYFYKKRNH